MARTEWKAAKLDELGFVGRGRSRHRPRNAAFLYGGPYPFFQTGDIKAASLHLTDYSQTYSEEGLAQSKLWKPGTLCITIAANIAESAILGIEGCFPDSVVGFVADPERADVRFIKYYMETLKLQMQSVSRGTTQDNLSLDKLLTFDFRAPPLPVQRLIAGILSAYDELIENSQRRIRLLEAIARAVYREWFVHFRFPGSERSLRIASPLGDIPQGWGILPISKLATVVLGGTPSRSVNEYWEGGSIPWLKSGKLNDIRVIDGTESITSRGLEMSATKLMPPRTVLVAITGAILVSFLEIEACANQSVVGIYDLSKVCPEYLHIYLSENISMLVSKMSGSAQQHINKDIVEQTPVLIPTHDVAEAFRCWVQPLYEEISVLLYRSRTLARTRDLLLPRLLSGQIEVEPT